MFVVVTTLWIPLKLFCDTTFFYYFLQFSAQHFMHTIDFTRQRKIHEFITDLHLQTTQDRRIHTCVHDQSLVCFQKCFFKGGFQWFQLCFGQCIGRCDHRQDFTPWRAHKFSVLGIDFTYFSKTTVLCQCTQERHGTGGEGTGGTDGFNVFFFISFTNSGVF